MSDVITINGITYVQKVMADSEVKFNSAGEAMRFYRRRLDLSQAETAIEFGWCNQSISNMENNKTTLTIDNFIKLCKLYGADPAKVITEIRWAS